MLFILMAGMVMVVWSRGASGMVMAVSGISVSVAVVMAVLEIMGVAVAVMVCMAMFNVTMLVAMLMLVIMFVVVTMRVTVMTLSHYFPPLRSDWFTR